MVEARSGVSAVDESRARRIFRTFGVPHFWKLYTFGLLWSIGRWGTGFLGAYAANELSGSPRLVQLTGTFLWAPMLLAGMLGGAISDRVDRRLALLGQFGVLIPLTLLIGGLAATDRLQTWMLYPYLLMVGFGWVIDMTARRSMVHDLVGDEELGNAMALEQFNSGLGLSIGAVAGGSFVGFFGLSGAYFAVAVVMALAVLIVWTVPSTSQPAAASPTGTTESFAQSVASGFRLLPANPTLLSILGVTVIVNLFHFSYFPIVQVIAERVGASPFETGLLAAATGLGMMVSTVGVLMFQPHRGRVYVLGSGAGMVLMLGFALFRSYGLVFVSLAIASIGIGLFGSTQSALTLGAARTENRGRAMGLLSMSIGALPIGMYVLGEAAERWGAPRSLVVSNLVGLAVLILWLWRRPQVLSID